MAEITGFLREDATFGEKQTCKLLEKNLPKEYTVYVETPIHKKREIRYPDFIVLTNYGVIVLEVKDWITVTRADPQGTTVQTRQGGTRYEPNPVGKARELAIALSNQLNAKCSPDGFGEAVPWSYAAVLINLPTSVITQLRKPWGEEFVLGKADLENPDLLLNRLRNTFPVKRLRSLTRQELDLARGVIYPVVEIEIEGRPPFVLDTQQEKIVTEPVRQETPPETRKVKKEEEARLQGALFTTERQEERGEELPDAGRRLSQNVAIRLVRGFSGSGKTLVIIQRAKFLEAQFPEWKIGVLTYNKPLQDQLASSFSDSHIRPRTFHSICRRLIRVSEEGEASLEDWLDERLSGFPAAALGKSPVRREIDWLREIGVTGRDQYLAVERRGVGKDLRLPAEMRHAVFDVYESYRNYLRENALWDWQELPLMVLEGLENGSLKPEVYDALLIDEAQDWAPVWFKIIQHLLEPEHGLLFLADDPSQSIYRLYSWKEKGIHIVGRTRWLRAPYRNTYEIYRAAYSLIDGFAEIQTSLSEEGELVAPEISSEEMRHGPHPRVRRCASVSAEMEQIKNTIDILKREGFRDEQIAVLARYRQDLDAIQAAVKGYGVRVSPIHSFKGLEMEAVILPHLQKTFRDGQSDHEASERRLLYMAMSRARERL